ncbi:MAG: glycosyltransferase family 4 protein [Chthoniobacterales bacterium]
MVTTFYPPYHFGGDGIFVYRLAEELAERGHLVDVFHSVDAYRLQHREEPEAAFPHHPNVTRRPLKTLWPRLSALGAHQFGHPAAYAAQLGEWLDREFYDVIHYHNISLMGGPGVLRLGGAVKLYTAHEYWLVCPTHVLFRFNRVACEKKKCLRCQLVYKRPPQFWRYTRLMERSLREIDCLLAPSEFAKARLAADGVACPMQVLPHFVPVPAEPAETTTVSGAAPYFLFAGRLEKLKGVQDLIHLFAKYREAEFVIAGEGHYAPELRQQARGLQHVRFLGSVNVTALSALYRGAIAVLAPSLCYETFSLAAAEALAHGTPVIARRLGALTEIIESSRAGFLFDSLEECRLQMERLRTDPALRDSLATAARSAVAENWTAEIHLRRYLAIVGSLIAQRANRQDGRSER